MLMSKRSRVLFSAFLSVILVFGLCPTAYADSAASGEESAGSAVKVESMADNEVSREESFFENVDQGEGAESSQGGSSSEGSIETEGSAIEDDEEESSSVKTESIGAPMQETGSDLAISPQGEAPSEGEARIAKNVEQNLPDGDYLIMSSVSGNRLLDVSGGSRSNGAVVQTYSYNNTGAQKWRVSHDGNGYLIIKNIGSGKVLDVRGASVRNGAQIQQYASNNTMAQRWLTVKNADGTYTIVSAMNEKKAIDISGASTAVGAKAQLYDKNGSKAQKFTFKSLNPKVDPCEKVIEDGYYEVASAVNGGYVLDIFGASLSNGANVQLYKRNGTHAQLFRFVYSNGYYKIQAASGKYVDVASAGLFTGTNIQQYAGNSTNAQLWSVRKNADGSFTFVSKANALVMDVKNGRAANGSNIQCYSSNGSGAQKFTLKKRENLLNNGVYTVRPAISSTRVLDVKFASTANGANVQLYSSNGSQAQKWSVSLVQGRASVYTLRSIVSGKYLTMDSSGNVCQRNGVTDGSQYWKASISAGKTVFTNEKYGKVLDVSGASNRDGANIQGYKWNSTGAQRFTLDGTAILGNGTYVIKCAADGSQVLDVASGSRNNGANIQVYKNNNTGAQKWNIARNGDGTYRLVNAQSGKALDVSGGVAQSGRNVQQYQGNSSKAQKWLIVDNADGTFKLASALDKSLVLTIATSPKNGANVCVSKDSGLSTQRFRFGPTSYNEISYSGLPADQRAMLKKINGKSSGTQYLIAVNRATHKVGVFKGAAGRWSYQYYWSCVTGAPSTPTITGTFRTTGYKRAVLSTDSRAKKCTQIKGGYFFHTILSSTNELGKSLSHGCVRLAPLSAIWIYNNVGAGTTVVIY